MLWLKRGIVYQEGIGIIRKRSNRFMRSCASVVVSVLVIALCGVIVPTDVFADTEVPTTQTEQTQPAVSQTEAPSDSQATSQPEAAQAPTAPAESEPAPQPAQPNSGNATEPQPINAEASLPEAQASSQPVALPPASDPTPDSVIATDVDAANAVNQQTTSGDTTIANNDDTGSAITGNASGTVDLLNAVNDVTSLGGTVVLEQIPVGNATLLISPPSQSSSATPTQPPSGLVAVTTDTDIENMVIVDTTTGNALLANNDDTGDAISGDALSDVSILNMANTVIATGDVYVGVITIDGDFNGDIVLSNDFLAKLHSINTTPTTSASLIDLNVVEGITNNVTAAAKSGTATLDGNDDTGGASTGNAATYVLIKNYAGSFILYGNSLLIIVNVTGDWIGSLLGMPNTSTAALSLNNGTPAPTALAQSSSPPSTQNSGISGLIVRASTSIANTVIATATSGNASLVGNDDTGSARSGDALVRVQILNIINTVVGFGDWLGIVFINVFGDFYGNVYMQPNATTTSIANPAPQTASASPLPTVAIINTQSAPRPQFRINTVATSQSQPQEEQEQKTIVAATSSPNDFTPTPIASTTLSESSRQWLLLVTILSCGLYVGYKLYEAKLSSPEPQL